MRFFTILIWLFCSAPIFTQAHDSTTPAPWLTFVRNDHQWDKDILYRADIPGGFLFIRHHSLQYVFYDTKAVGALHFDQAKPATAQAKIESQPAQPTDNFIRAHGFTLTFAGARPEALIEALQPNSEKRNYFLGKDPSRWASNVPAFQEIVYHNLYPGIDLRLFNYHNSLKYELLVAPGADTRKIRFQYEGVDKIAIAQEQLVIQTSLNTINETKPYCYQRIKGQTKEVAARFVLNNNEVTFQFPESYQRNQALVIDPVLVFSTYSGSRADNWGHCATFDAADNLYSGGTVFGADFPTTNGAYQVDFGGYIDVAIMKYNPLGTALLYATYLGGGEAEVPHSMTANKKGELLILGTTSSKNFPIATNAPYPTFGGGTNALAIGGIKYSHGCDLFISKLNPQGSQLLGSTYMGGSENDGLRTVVKPLDPKEKFIDTTFIKNYGDQFRSEIITDAQDNVYVASVTNSPNFPVKNPVQAFFPSNYDAVIFRLNPSLSSLEWSTPFGGEGLEAAYSLRISSSGSLYVCGVTKSTQLPTKTGALRRSLFGSEDGFVAQFKNDQLVQASYLGTIQADQAMLLDLDAENNVYIFGVSHGNYPVSTGVYTNKNSHQFIHKIDPSLSKTLFSTVIGSGRNTPDLAPTALLINECGNIYLSGWGGQANNIVGNKTSSTFNLPVTPDGIRTTTNGDDFYIMVLEKEAKSLLYGTFFGSQITQGQNGTDVGRNHVDGGTSRFNKKGVIYHAACACGGNGFPTTPGAWSNKNLSSNCNNASFKFDIELLKAGFDVYDSTGTKDITTGCTPFTAYFLNTSVGGIIYKWDIAGLATSADPDQIGYTFTEPGDYEIKLVAYNRLTCMKKDSTIKKIRVLKADFKVSGPQKLCLGESTALTAEGGDHYSWTPTAGLNDPAIANPIATPLATTRYKVKITKDNGCVGEKEVVVVVDQAVVKASFDMYDKNGSKDMTIGCTPFTVLFENTSLGGGVYEWNFGGLATSTAAGQVSYTFDQPGEYVIKLKAHNSKSCFPRDSTVRTIKILKADFKVSSDQKICVGSSIQLQAEGGDHYLWSPTIGLDNPTIANPVASPTVSTTYHVNISKDNGCIDNYPIFVDVIQSNPNDFALTFSEECGNPIAVHFTNNINGADKFTWLLGNGDTLQGATPNPYIYKSGTYEVGLMVYRGNCIQTLTKTIKISQLALPPNVVTPNGDGYNDTFFLLMKDVKNKVSVDGYKLEIYNRWGKSVYQSESYQSDWGPGAANGLYYYLLTSPLGAKCKGWVQVLQ
ncbi:MAG: gliding motility-associated C-terminal domain-containing protein [Bacteroidota bacterium]